MTMSVLRSSVFSMVIHKTKGVTIGSTNVVRKASDTGMYTGMAKGFTWEGMKKHYAVLPLVVIMSFAVLGVAGFSVYSALTRDAVMFDRSKKPVWERMDLLNPHPKKLVTFNQPYVPMEELHYILQEMKEAEKKQ